MLAIKNGIKTIFEGVTTPEPGVKNVQLYRRNFERVDEFVKEFAEIAPGGGAKILTTWIIEPPAAVADPTQGSGHTHKLWTFIVTGYMSLNDDLQTEQILDRLMEQIEDAVLGTEQGFTLDSSVIAVKQIRTSQGVPIFFGRTMVNVASVELDVETHRQYC
jgi:hypothetical protein